MSQLKEAFKTREEICLWLEKNKTALEEKVGFKMQFTSVVELGILAEVENTRDLRIISIPDFELLRDTLETMEGFITGEIGGDKYIGAIILAGEIPKEFTGYIAKIKCMTKIFRIYLLEVDDETKMPVFKEYQE